MLIFIKQYDYKPYAECRAYENIELEYFIENYDKSFYSSNVRKHTIQNLLNDVKVNKWIKQKDKEFYNNNLDYSDFWNF